LVDKGAFRRLLIFTRPSLLESDIPHRTKIHDEIILRANAAEERVCSVLSKIKGKVSFTFDTWTSEAEDPYLSVTGHYITAPDGRPHEWVLKTVQLAFTHFEGNHSGANMANVLMRTIDRYNLRKKVYFMTSLVILFDFLFRLVGLQLTMPVIMVLLFISSSYCLTIRCLMRSSVIYGMCILFLVTYKCFIIIFTVAWNIRLIFRLKHLCKPSLLHLHGEFSKK